MKHLISLLSSLLVIISLFVSANWLTLLPLTAEANGPQALRFYGHGKNDIDRVKIPIDPDVPVDVGENDFTLEWWMKALPGENGSSNCNTSGVGWIYGNIIFDRDIWGDGDYGDYGISLSRGRIAFGVSNQTQGTTICGATNIDDGQWHHVAVTRRRSDGQLQIYVDGQLDRQGSGPRGNVSYRDGRPVEYANEPYLVIGAEKHDAGSAYPSFSGLIDEVRLSKVVRYAQNFSPQSTPFVTDENTVALYHFDEGFEESCTGTVLDSSGAVGGPSHGTCFYGGSAPAGPIYVSDNPFSNTNSPTPTVTATPISAPSATPTPVPSATPLPTETSAPSPTSTPNTDGDMALSFDGTDDVARAGKVLHTGPMTIEAWVRPASTSADGLLIVGADKNDGWSFEINNGQPTLWLSTDQGWQPGRSPISLQGEQWYHLAATYDGTAIQMFVNGVGSESVNVGSLTQGPTLQFGGLDGYPYFKGVLDEIRISNNVRYTADFALPTAPFAPDTNTLGLWHFDEGEGQIAADASASANQATLGTTSDNDSADPSWTQGVQP